MQEKPQKCTLRNYVKKMPNSMIEAAVYWSTSKVKNSVGIQYYFKVSMQMYNKRK